MVIEATAAEYNRIADAIRHEPLADSQQLGVALSLAVIFTEMNRRFKPLVFIQRCLDNRSEMSTDVLIQRAADYSPVLAQRLLTQVRKGTEN